MSRTRVGGDRKQHPPFLLFFRFTTFFVVGGGLLAFVNVAEGQRLAREAEQAFADAAR